MIHAWTYRRCGSRIFRRCRVCRRFQWINFGQTEWSERIKRCKA